ncbi:MAG: WD40/YVTN/BNR-like repeat-containing protein, partial [bacterium]
MRRTSAAVFAAIASASPSHAAPSFYWANPRPTGSELGGVEFESATVGYAVGAFGASLRSTDGGITWEARTPLSASGIRLDDVLVLSPGVLLAAGAAPGLHRSTDGGLTFSPVANPGNVRLRNLFALDASTLFAVGDAGRVLRSTDGGAGWSLLGSPAAATLVDQWWLDAQRAYVIGESCVRRTTDGGVTWSTIPNISEFNVSFPGDIQFLDAQNGWIFTDFATYRTTNGGATWAELPLGFPIFPIYQEEALVLGPQTRLVATEAEGAAILKTTNDGASWTTVFDHPGTRGVTDLERLAGGAIVAVTTDGDLLRSTDDGATWTNFTTVAGTPTREDIEVLDVHASGVGFAGGWGAIWIATTDGGRTWFDPPSNPGVAAFAIAVRDPLFVLAGGSGGATGHSDVRRTTDGGATWTTHDLSASFVGYPQGLVAFDDGTCFCVTYGGDNLNFVYRSTDGGSTWHLRGNGVSANVRLFDLFFLDSQRGFVCGGEFTNPAIYRTTDGGGLWTPVGESGLAATGIRDMAWLDEVTGIVVSLQSVQRTT